ncbi:MULTISPECIES: hypothetical protein [Arenimonas]|uniref:EF-hand domain-containing protein n=1 Tax=Arenimonas metalli CF5-1 TaxID=1384056 RepID=A0A091BUN6_9GAMM|nr:MULTISPECIES: hypothetical protein [Arenimonas]KFN48055.1 hypothetical protein N787_06355 [Arenimonas metalli CF5-1]HEX4852806.1 hypothetical protein [Arenimonas sp.]
MNKNPCSAALAAITLALSGAAFAATPPPVDGTMANAPVQDHASIGFDEIDKDADGFVVQSDLPPEHELALQFAAADLDRDQRLSRDEFDAFEESPEEEEAEE